MLSLSLGGSVGTRSYCWGNFPSIHAGLQWWWMMGSGLSQSNFFSGGGMRILPGIPARSHRQTLWLGGKVHVHWNAASTRNQGAARPLFPGPQFCVERVQACDSIGVSLKSRHHAEYMHSFIQQIHVNAGLQTSWSRDLPLVEEDNKQGT